MVQSLFFIHQCKAEGIGICDCSHQTNINKTGYQPLIQAERAAPLESKNNSNYMSCINISQTTENQQDMFCVAIGHLLRYNT